MNANELTFQELIRPLSKAQFFTEVEGQVPRHFRGDERRFSDLFSWSDVEHLLDQSSLWSELSLKLVLDGAEVALENYSEQGTTRDGQRAMLPVSARVNEYLQRGATLVLDRVEVLTPVLAALTRHLESVLGASIACNVYCSWQAHQGFPSHFDTTDVYVLQIAGIKHWNLYSGRAQQPSAHPGHHYSHFDLQHHARAKGAVLEKLELSAGDMLYLPRGQYHDALAGSAASLHLSFGVNRALGVDFMHALIESLGDDVCFRQELAHFDQTRALRIQLRNLADRLHEQLTDASVVEQVAAWQRQRVLRSTPVNMRLPERQLPSWFRVRQTGQRLDANPAGVQLLDGEGRALKLSEADLQPLNWILEQELFAVQTLVAALQLEPALVQNLLERLCQAGFLEAL